LTLSDFKLFNQSVLNNDSSGIKKDFLSGKAITLRYDQNFFSFDFTALEFLNSSAIRYAYKLEGVDNDWVYCGNNRTANYTKVHSGTYTFFVRSTNVEGTWNRDAISIPVVILPPWWQTWWFRVVIFFVCVGLTMLALRFYMKQKLRAQQEEIQKQQITELLNTQEIKSLNAMMDGQEKERKRIAADLHDRIGSSLSAIKLHFTSFAKTTGVDTENREQFSRVNAMFDNVVKEVRQVSHDLASGVLMKFGVVSALKDLNEGIESSGNMKVNLYTHGLDERLDHRTEISLYRITQELISNVLKHAQAKEINVHLNRQDGHISLMVEDDGIGFDPKKASGGIGMRNIRSRVTQAHGTIFFDSSPGKGCTVTIEIPLTSKS
jgi:signal transduction histidine kinase